MNELGIAGGQFDVKSLRQS